MTLPVFSSGSLVAEAIFPALPSVTPSLGSSSQAVSPGSAAASLPQKLVKKILDLEYIDMAELISDSWRLQEESEGVGCCHHSKRPKRGPVSDIVLWTDCYATLVSVLVEKYPGKAAGFLAYLKTILKAQRSFQGEAWVSYDMAYRRRAANQKSLDWGVIDFTLYNEAFAGRIKAVIRCKYCLSDLHSSADCCYSPIIDQGKRKQLKGAGDR